MSNIIKILEVKQMTVDALNEVIKSNEIADPQDQFEQIMQLLQFNNSAELAQAAFYAADSIEDSSIKAACLSELLGEISYMEDQLSDPDAETITRPENEQI